MDGNLCIQCLLCEISNCLLDYATMRMSTILCVNLHSFFVVLGLSFVSVRVLTRFLSLYTASDNEFFSIQLPAFHTVTIQPKIQRDFRNLKLVSISKCHELRVRHQLTFILSSSMVYGTVYLFLSK